MGPDVRTGDRRGSDGVGLFVQGSSLHRGGHPALGRGPDPLHVLCGLLLLDDGGGGGRSQPPNPSGSTVQGKKGWI